jgi:hypothetical protein
VSQQFGCGPATVPAQPAASEPWQQLLSVKIWLVQFPKRPPGFAQRTIRQRILVPCVGVQFVHSWS